MTDLLGEILRADAGTATVRFERSFATDVDDLWNAVTSADRLARWFAPVTGDLREGGAFTIRFDDGDIPSCRVVRCDPPRSFAWEWGDDDPSLVEVALAADGPRSRLTLVHSRLPLGSAPGYGAGWQAYVRSLAAHLGAEDAPDWWSEFAAVRDGYAEALGA